MCNRRILFTLITLGLAVVSMLLASDGSAESTHLQRKIVALQELPIAPALQLQDSTTNWVQVGMGEQAHPGTDTIDGFPTHHRSGRAEQVAWAHDDDQNQDVLWVGTSNGGLWKPIVNSDGVTQKYIPLTDNFPGSHTLGSFLIHPHDSHKILIGTGSRWGTGDGIYFTSDGGQSWSTNVLSVEPEKVLRMASDRSDVDTVLAATSQGIWRNRRFGQPGTNWKKLLKGNCTDILQDPNHPNKWYAGMLGVGVMYSEDGGDNWCTLGTGITGDIGRVSLAASKSDDHLLFALVVMNFPNDRINGVFRFDNLAANTAPFCNITPWTKIYSDDEGGPTDPLGEGNHTCSIVCDPTNANHVLFGLKRLIETHHATGTVLPSMWTKIDGGHGDLNDFLFLPNDPQHRWVSVNDGGFYIMTPSPVANDSAPYIIDDSQNLLGISAFERTWSHEQGSLSSSDDDPDEFAAGLQDNGVIIGDIEAENVLAQIDSGDGGETSFKPGSRNVIGFSSSGGGGYRFMSLDRGDNFLQIDCGQGGERFSTVLIDPTPGIEFPKIFSYNHDDDGLHSKVLFHDFFSFVCPWESVGSPARVDGEVTHVDHTTNDQLHVIPFTVTNDFHVFAYVGPRALLGSLVKIDITPQQLSCSDPDKVCIQDPDTRINADRSSSQPNTLYYTTGTGHPSRAFVSRDNGFHWTRVARGGFGGLAKSLDFEKLIGHPGNPAEFYLATSRGVFHTIDSGATWEPFSHGLRLHEEVSDIVINMEIPTGPRLYILTRGRGFWMRTLTYTVNG